MSALLIFSTGAFLGAAITALCLLIKQDKDLDWLIAGLRELERTHPFILQDLEKALDMDK